MRIRRLEPASCPASRKAALTAPTAERADQVAGVGVGPAERVGEGRRLGVDRIGSEAHRRHDQEEREQARLVEHEPEALPQPGLAAARELARGGLHEQDADDEHEIGAGVDRERGRDPELAHRERGERRPDRAREVVRHRVERDRGLQLRPRHEVGDQRLRGGRRERADDAETERAEHHDPDRREPLPGEHGEQRR